ncbi:MAG: hypothetical protein J5J06_06930 [Phycisphaerae bacterium]|nr:hypothetical protein [Phycisphaerae bacterium]
MKTKVVLSLLSALILCSLPVGRAFAADAADRSDSASVEALPEPAVPALADHEKLFLSRVARRALRDTVLGRDPYEPDYIPSSLQEKTTEVVVRLRQGGFLLAASSGGPAPIADAVRDAAAAAGKNLAQVVETSVGDSAELLIEIEVVGPAQAIPSVGDWTQPRAVDSFIEPGVHGMVLAGPSGTYRFCPTEVFTSDVTVAQGLRSLARQVQKNPMEIPKTRLYRFRTIHWYQAKAGAEIVSLHRGLVLVPPEAVTADELDRAIEELAEYMVWRQKPSGLFSYEYEPARDAFSDEDNLVRQVGATLALTLHARESGLSASLAASDKGIRYHLQGLRDIPGRGDAAFIATADGKNKLGVTALLALALAQHPDRQKYTDVRSELIEGMLWLQRPSGMFVTAFPPAENIEAQDYFPGEALLAMAEHYTLDPSAKILDAFNRAMGFYREYFRGIPSPALVPWQSQAYALMAQHGRRQDYAGYVFELTDWLAKKQLTPENCTWPELWGGIAAYQKGRAGVATASYLEGFADALRLARELNDQERVKRYEKIVRGATRFVLQLRIRPEEAYFIRSPKNAVGGVRTTPALDLLRIDHCQHALVGLMKARHALFDHGG